MKKLVAIFSVIAVLLAAALTLAPYAFGKKTEAVFNERLRLMAKKSRVEIVRSSFQRGWFESTADVSIRVPGLPVEIESHHVIYHGPFLLSRWLAGDFDLTPRQAQIDTHATTTITSGPAATDAFSFSIATRIDIDGTAKSHIESPALKKKMADGSTLDWHGVQGDATFDQAFSHIRTELRAPKLVHPSIRISDVRFRSQLTEGIAGHYLGDSDIDIGDVVASFAQAKNLSVKLNSSAQGQALSFGVSYDVAQIRIGEGPAGSARLALTAKKIDAEILARFQRELQSLQNTDKPAEQLGLLRLGKLTQLVGDLSKKTPELEITEFHVRMGADDIVGKAKFVLDGSRVDISKNPMLILTTLIGDVEVSLSPGLLKPILLPLLHADLNLLRQQKQLSQQTLSEEQLSAILDQALPLYLSRNEFTRHLVADGGRYRLTASLRRGQVLVNGEPLNIGGAGLLPALK